MKSKVALIATLLALIALVLLFSFNCSKLADESNDIVRSRLENAAGILTAFGEDISNGERTDMLSSMSKSKGLFRGLYKADGTAVYTSSADNDALQEADLAKLSAGRVQYYTQKNSEGHEELHAIYQYEDGAVFLLSAETATIASVLKDFPTITWFGGVLALCLILFIIVLIGVRSREKCVNKVMKTLDRFADGDFDARIEGFGHGDPNVEEYNAIIERIQDRIFKQKNRNHVLSTVMSQMQNGIIAVDQNMKVMFVTPVAKHLLGITGNSEGLHVSEASKDVNLEKIFSEAMQQKDGVYTNEVAARTAVGRAHRPLRLYVSSMKQDSTVNGALAIVEDITELRQMEQLRTDFAANVSHELKTPLTSIMGWVETLQDGAIEKPDLANRCLDIIDTESKRLKRLIDDILSISKFEAGNNEAPTERLSLNKTAYDVCFSLTPQAKAKDITIVQHLDATPVFIIGNPDQLKQLLINLTENAIKYNRQGGTVTVQVFTNGDEANISISDTGIGIAEENIPRLFERFYRVDKGRSREMGGTGLGLAIVKHIVKVMNGEIEVHSKLGEGTEFLVTLPLAPKEDPDKDTIFEDGN